MRFLIAYKLLLKSCVILLLLLHKTSYMHTLHSLVYRSDQIHEGRTKSAGGYDLAGTYCCGASSLRRQSAPAVCAGSLRRQSLPAVSAGSLCWQSRRLRRQSPPAVSAGSLCRQSPPAVSAGSLCRQSLPAVSAGSLRRQSPPAVSLRQLVSGS